MPEFFQESREPNSEAITIREVINVLSGQKRLIASVATVFTVTAGLLALAEPRIYKADAVIRLSEARPMLIGDRELPEFGLSRATDPLLSRLEVLRSRTLVGSVVDSLGLRLVALGDDPFTAEVSGMKVDENVGPDTITIVFDAGGLVVSGQEGTTRVAYGDTARLGGIEFSIAEQPGNSELIVAVLPRELAIDRVLANLQVVRREGTDVVDVSYLSQNPYLAQSVANALVSTFKEQRVLAARQQSRVRREFLEEQLEQTDRLLRASQSDLASYRSSQNLAGSAERISAEQRELMSLETRLSELRADRQIVAGVALNLETSDPIVRAEALRTAAALPQLASQQAVLSQIQQLNRYQTTLDSMTTGPFRVAPTNPDAVQLRSLVSSTEERIAQSLGSYAAALDARIAALESLRSRSAATVQALPGKEAEETRLSRQVEVTREMADELRLEYQQARIAENVQIGDVEIVDMAALPYRPVAALWPFKLVVGLLLGLVSGILIAFVREARNNSIRKPQELNEVLHLPQLAIIPHTPELAVHGSRKTAGFLPRLPSRADSASDEATAFIEKLGTTDTTSREAFRVLRTSVLSSSGDERPRSVAVTSVGPGEGKTVTAVNLAISFAHKGMTVVLVDCDVRRPRVHTVLDLPRAPGLADLLSPRSSYFLRVPKVLKKTPLMNLSVIPCGSPPLDALELFEGAAIRRLLADLNDRFDIVILDTPPVLAAADTAIVGQLVDGAVIVIRAGKTDREEAQRAYAQLTLAKVQVLGAIFNDPDGKYTPYGGRYGPGSYTTAAEYVDA